MKTRIIPIIIIAGLLSGVAFKSLSRNHFRNDARKMAELSFTGSNLVTTATLGQLKGSNLFVNLDKEKYPSYDNQIVVSAENLMDKENLKILNKHKGNIILISNDQAKVARTWMLLAQVGIKNLFILQ
ncbi:MAG TPA: hypothetical protein VK179_02860 [Bacteroidales bacterium]|nr:hypothetical protein [Bacteroidales bacterium]